MKTQYKNDVNSVKNQAIKGKLVQREIHCNVNSVVEYILNNSENSDAPFSWDDVENLISPKRVKENQYRYIIDDSEEETFSARFVSIDEDEAESDTGLIIDEKEYARLKEGGNDPESGLDVAITYLHEKGNFMGFTSTSSFEVIEEDDDIIYEEGEVNEIYEWWAVSSWFAGRLKEYGEPILDCGSFMSWGRCTSGEAILLDSVISSIALDMQILEGQPNEWK